MLEYSNLNLFLSHVSIQCVGAKILYIITQAICMFLCSLWASLIAQSVKNLPAMQETWVQFLGWEDPLEKEMATHSSIFAWRILLPEKPGSYYSMGSWESDKT